MSPTEGSAGALDPPRMPLLSPLSGPPLLWGAGIALLFVALFVVTYFSVIDESALPRRYFRRYTVSLESRMRRMFIWSKAMPILIGQLVAILAFVVLRVMADMPLWWLGVAVAALVPTAYLERMRQKRVLAIEEQVDGFVTALANALKSTPSVGDAFKSVQALLRDPIRQELELANKEIRLGATLDQALLMMASRVGCRPLDSAVSAVLVGRQVGGNLPRILDTTASSLRELARLEGVVRTKTAEGRMQLWVLGVFPFAIMLALDAVSPGYFDPLKDSLLGYTVTAIAAASWVASLIVARKILAVDI